MARKPRYTTAEYSQHVVQRSHNRESIFVEASDYRVYSELLGEASRKYRCAIHSYALVPDGVQLLMTPSIDDGVSKFMQSVNRNFSHYANRTRRRTGTLWEGRYRAALVDAVACLLKCHYYIEAYPVRARQANSAGEYMWSSYARNAHGRPDALICPHAAYVRIGSIPEERQRNYRELFEKDASEDIKKEISAAIVSGGIIGRPEFKERMEGLLLRRVTTLPRGGDHKSEQYRTMARLMMSQS